jgi:hypothetical protein
MSVTALPVKGKTEQRVTAVVSLLRTTAKRRKGKALTYEEISRGTDTAYDILLYILATLVEVECVERIEDADGPGRPKVRFRWISDAPSAQAMGA